MLNILRTFTDPHVGKNSTRSLLISNRVIVKSGVSASESSGDLINSFHLDSIFEFDSFNDLRQIIEAA